MVARAFVLTYYRHALPGGVHVVSRRRGGFDDFVRAIGQGLAAPFRRYRPTIQIGPRCRRLSLCIGYDAANDPAGRDIGPELRRAHSVFAAIHDVVDRPGKIGIALPVPVRALRVIFLQGDIASFHPVAHGIAEEHVFFDGSLGTM